MQTKYLLRVSGMILAGIAASIVLLALVYALQDPQVVMKFATVSWNGEIPL